MLLVAPTEPVRLRSAGKVSLWPESVGCDVAVFTGGRKIGVQRKELGDLIASMDDGRLAEQVARMAGSLLDRCVVLIEGDPEFIGNGADAALVQRWKKGRTWTRGAIWAIEWDLRSRGVDVVWVRGLGETIAWLELTDKWWGETRAHALSRRPAAPTQWGTAMSWEWGAWVLQGFPGIGPELASRIMGKFGRLPIRWTCEPDELAEVDGISKMRAEKWVRELNGTDDDEKGR